MPAGNHLPSYREAQADIGQAAVGAAARAGPQRDTLAAQQAAELLTPARAAVGRYPLLT